MSEKATLTEHVNKFKTKLVHIREKYAPPTKIKIGSAKSKRPIDATNVRSLTTLDYSDPAQLLSSTKFSALLASSSREQYKYYFLSYHYYYLNAINNIRRLQDTSVRDLLNANSNLKR